MTDDRSASDDGAGEVDLEDLTTRLKGALDGLDGGGDETEEGVDEDGGDGAADGPLSSLDDVERLVEEVRELLETIDFENLPDAVDVEELPEAIDADAIPDAVANADPGEAVDGGKLLRLIELGELLDSVDVRDFWQNKRELDDAVEDVTGGGEGDGDDGMLSDADLDVDAGDALEADADLDELDDLSEYEVAIQSQLSDSVEVFREKIVETHERLDALRAENEARVGSLDQPSSRNPTAYSTVPRRRTAVSGAARFSTVPRDTRYSNAPNHERIYGSRFRKERGEDDG
ncbi:hypothetical protein [Halegenticoccus soli]|uniref:hypothetical protein n=1 Tax=Halegenticoccus soli TaxID=1985678 RepID=UPI0018EC5E77|nr:hypothetical protein [Halegenticoccus soli]